MTGAAAMLAEPHERYPTVDEFENGSLDPVAFDHEAHVYVAWQMLNESPVLAAMQRFTAALQRLTRALGADGKYHETVTCLFIAIIAERRSDSPSQNWSDFKAGNDDLISDARRLLERHYSADRLWSNRARQQFLLPDKGFAG